ncbi:GDP-mannose 4,6-dehydratase [Sabulilitoribacter arenilitoris]|uniref:GDP-mannose 4,6-dehydratase n=1 Tax=Wocania arenilitoris TaxID=2044858 RepID=A0AAE3EK73_9FLAO|nr:GDP-mannose 4,6-dehydratase [Wocania arenilitoris]MCF7566780.1 GDP-mannose 4,6-dehydratase [Wocania arenilitoris]
MEALSKKKVFITGINGFTGVHLEKHLLQKGFEVFGTTLNKSDNPKHFPCDILKEEDFHSILNTIKPEYVVHLAAISFVASKDKQNIYNVNIFGTLNLLEALNKLDYIPNKILIASSAAVYGNIEGELDESMCPQPVNHYGNSKLVMENMIKSYFEKQNIIITRPFNYTGIGQEPHFLVPKIVSHFKENKSDISLGNIDVYREFNDVDYVIECYEKLLISNLKSDIINVCSGKALNIKYIINSMENLANYKIDVTVNPDFIRKNEIKTLIGSNKKLISVIGDFSSNYKIEGTLKKMYKH